MRLNFLALSFFLYATVSAARPPPGNSLKLATSEALPPVKHEPIKFSVIQRCPPEQTPNAHKTNTHRAPRSLRLEKRGTKFPYQDAAKSREAIYFGRCVSAQHLPDQAVFHRLYPTRYAMMRAFLRVLPNTGEEMIQARKEVSHLEAVNQFFAWGHDDLYIYIIMDRNLGEPQHVAAQQDPHFFGDYHKVLEIEDQAVRRYYLKYGIVNRKLYPSHDVFLYRQSTGGKWVAEIIDWSDAVFTGNVKHPTPEKGQLSPLAEHSDLVSFP